MLSSTANGNEGASSPMARSSRKLTSGLTSTPASKKVKTGPEVQKGLRHFSIMVCNKVESKGKTTYNQVADELVQDFKASSLTGASFDHKNIRRRVYDALNVLMAMDIIEKDKNKKEIRWLGFPTDSDQTLKKMQQEIEKKEKSIQSKRKLIQDLLLRQIALRNLVKRNARLEEEFNVDNSMDRLELPFVLINAPKNSKINCEMLQDRSEYFFEFDVPFLINEDIEVLRMMGMGQTTVEDLKLIIPKELMNYLPFQMIPPEFRENENNDDVEIAYLQTPSQSDASNDEDDN